MRKKLVGMLATATLLTMAQVAEQVQRTVQQRKMQTEQSR